MNKVRAIFAVLTVVTLFGTAAIFCGAGSSGSGRWEYTFVSSKDNIFHYEDRREQFIQEANNLGKDGWELVSAPSWDGRVGAIFKRKLP
jgi:hypothetical protein